MLTWALLLFSAGKIDKQISTMTSSINDVGSMTTLILPRSASNTSGNSPGRGYKRGGCRTQVIIPRPAVQRDTVSTLPLLLTDLFTIAMFKLYAIVLMLSFWLLKVIIMHSLCTSYSYPLGICRAAKLYGDIMPGFTYSTPLFFSFSYCFISLFLSLFLFAFLFLFPIPLLSSIILPYGVSPTEDEWSEEPSVDILTCG